MKKFVIASLFIFILAQSYGQIVLERNTEELSFFYIDANNNLVNYQTILKERKESDGFINIDSDFPVIVTFTRSRLNYPIYLEPGDTCTISLSKANVQEYDFSGNKSSNELQFLIIMERKFGFTFPDLDISLTPKVNIIEYLKLHQNLYKNRMEFIKRYSDSLAVSKVFLANMKNIIYYKYLRGALKPFYFPVADFDYKNLSEEYINHIDEFKSSIVDSMVNDLNYRLFLINYNKFLSKQYLTSSGPYTFETLFASARDNFKGKSREFLMFLLIKENASKALPNFVDRVVEFKKICSDPKRAYYIDSVYTTIFSVIPTKLESTQIETQSNKTLYWKSIIEKSRGKVIYVDFWASWCKPCLMEMPNSANLRSKVDKAKVTFMYFSIDSERGAWLKAIEKLPKNVANAEHYKLDANSELGQFFDLSSIPRYVIIDVNGKIAAFNANRPGSDDALSVINRLTRN